MQHPAERLLGPMSPAELDRVAVIDKVLPQLREHAAEADVNAEFHMPNAELIKELGLTGLVIPKEYGGMGGGLRDLCAATYMLGTACPSTALIYFFSNSASSRGLLTLGAIDAGLFDAQEAPVARAFAEKVLHRMGRDKKLLGNFASESSKNAKQAVTISTKATRTEGGWLLNGVKSFGTGTDVCDMYLVSAGIEGLEGLDAIGTFFVPRDAKGVRCRAPWDPIGLRASASNGLLLEDVFVPDEEALTMPGSFRRMMEVSRGSFVGNQVAAICCYLGGGQAVYDWVLEYLTERTFADTGAAIGSSPMHQELIGRMSVDLETGYLWLRRQIELETSDPPLLPKEEVIKQWRMCKGAATEALFNVAVSGLKACGTGNTANRGPVVRGLRDLSMGLVQAFPAERGRLEVAKMLVTGGFTPNFGTE